MLLFRKDYHYICLPFVEERSFVVKDGQMSNRDT